MKQKQELSTDGDGDCRFQANRLFEVFELIISINHARILPSSDTNEYKEYVTS